MKKIAVLIISAVFLLCMCSCGENASTSAPTTIQETGYTQPAKNQKPSYCGTWETTGLKVFSNDPGNKVLEITEDSITLSIDDETFGPLDYVASFDSDYTYLELVDNSWEFVVIQLNEDMVGLFSSTDDINAEYRCKTPWGMMINAEIDAYNIFMRRGAGTTTLPSSFNLEKMFSDSSSEILEYIYYPHARILQVYGIEGLDFYIFPGGGGTYMEAICLANLDSEDYSPHDIRTDSNFVITDTK